MPAAQQQQGSQWNVIPIRSRSDAVEYGDAWRAYAARLQAQIAAVNAAHLLASAQRDASDLLLREAEKEIERLRGLI